MANETISQIGGGVSLVVAPYERIKELPFSELAGDTLIIDAAELIRNASKNVRYPVTAFQLKRYVDEELEEELSHFGYEKILFIGVRRLFFDPNIREGEYLDLLSEIISRVRELSLSGGVEVLFIDFEERYEIERDIEISELLSSAVDVIFNSQASAKVVR